MSQLLHLAKPFPAADVKKNPSGYGNYVPHTRYVEKILYVCGGYDFEILRELYGNVEPKTNDDGEIWKEGLSNVLVGVVGRLTITCDGETHVVEEIGDCEDPTNWPHDGARGKDAVSDSFKRCAMRGWAIGLHMYGKADHRYILFDLLAKRAQSDEPEGEPDGE